MKFEVDTSTMTSGEALALAIFLTELFGLPRDLTLATSAPPANYSGTEDSRESDDAGQHDSGGPVPPTGRGETVASGEGARPPRKKVAKQAATFVLANKKTGVSHECNTGRKGDVELARGHLENWFRDAQTEEEIKGLADMAESFVATCLTPREQRAMAKVIAEAVENINPAKGSEEVAADDAKPAAEGLTIEAVKQEAKALAAAKGLPAVRTIMAQFDATSFVDLKESHYGEFLSAVRTAMKE